MGNSATKEQRLPNPQHRSIHFRRNSSPQVISPPSPTNQRSGDQIYSTQHGRSSRADLSEFLGISSGNGRETGGAEARRETKQEREARKLQRERVNRERERERSMREESVDGGYLVTQGVYTGMEDYNKAIVRHLMIERRMAPFWRGLNDHSSSWTGHQLVAAVKGMPVPAPDDIPQEITEQDAENGSEARPSIAEVQASNMNNLTVPMPSRSQSYQSDFSAAPPTSLSLHPLAPSSSAGSALLRGRAKTLAALTTTSSRNSTQAELLPRETVLPKNPYVNGQALEVYLYKDAFECPICFLYYPPYLNRTRCCDQPICSECFVQIKRPDPHPPEHSEPTAPSQEGLEAAEPGEIDMDEGLVSEPAACPFCVQPEFGVTFEPPPFRRGLGYVNQGSTHPSTNSASAMSSSSSLNSTANNRDTQPPISTSRRRTMSLSANASTVITTDRIRPDWATKLSTARAHAARRSAAATALHTAAYLMNNRNGLPDQRGFAYFGRRGLLRRGGGTDSPSGGQSLTHLNMLSLMSERYVANGGTQAELEPNHGESIPTIVGPPRDSSRRSRMQDLEDMMLMEAIRLSLVSEEDRQRREEKEAKREVKKKSKDEKKAKRIAGKAGMYSSSTNTSAGTLESPRSSTFSVSNGKGKEVRREGLGQSSDPGLSTADLRKTATPVESLVEGPQEPSEQGKIQLKPAESLQSISAHVGPAYKPSHLRNLSNVSSSASSSAVSLQGSNKLASQSSLELSPNASGSNITSVKPHDTVASLTPPRASGAIEPMFNFNSLAAMVDRVEKAREHSNAQLDEATDRDEPDLLRHELKGTDRRTVIENPHGTELGGTPTPSSVNLDSHDPDSHERGMFVD